MRILFMGTPEFAVASLRRLVEDGHEICGVLTQPDKPKNRGHKLTPTPVKEYALTKNLAVYQPQSLRNAESLELVRSLEPELTVVAAYGKLLPEEILNVPPLGSINVHSSLLPKNRGAAHLPRGDGGRPGPHPASRGAGGGGPVRDGQGLGGRYGLPHAPGPREIHLCPHAEPGAVSRGLDPVRP